MKLHHGGPIEYIGSKFRRSIPPNITRVRAKNQSKSSMSSLSRGKPTPFGLARTRVIRPEYLDTTMCRECATMKQAKALAKLFMEKHVIRYNKRWYVRCV